MNDQELSNFIMGRDSAIETLVYLYYAGPSTTIKIKKDLEFSGPASPVVESMTSKHPKRCETCHHYESGGQWCIPVKTRLSQLEIELIALVGCASHGSASEPAPEPEYIITEEMLQQWRVGCIYPSAPIQFDDQKCCTCKYAGEGIRLHCCDFDDDAMEKIFRSRPHTPAAPAMEYTIEQIAEIDNRIRKERKAEREQAAKRVDAFADSLHDIESIVIKGGLRELAESLRGGGAR